MIFPPPALSQQTHRGRRKRFKLRREKRTDTLHSEKTRSLIKGRIWWPTFSAVVQGLGRTGSHKPGSGRERLAINWQQLSSRWHSIIVGLRAVERRSPCSSKIVCRVDDVFNLVEALSLSLSCRSVCATSSVGGLMLLPFLPVPGKCQPTARPFA